MGWLFQDLLHPECMHPSHLMKPLILKTGPKLIFFLRSPRNRTNTIVQVYGKLGSGKWIHQIILYFITVKGPLKENRNTSEPDPVKVKSPRENSNSLGSTTFFGPQNSELILSAWADLPVIRLGCGFPYIFKRTKHLFASILPIKLSKTEDTFFLYIGNAKHVSLKFIANRCTHTYTDTCKYASCFYDFNPLKKHNNISSKQFSKIKNKKHK